MAREEMNMSRERREALLSTWKGEALIDARIEIAEWDAGLL